MKRQGRGGFPSSGAANSPRGELSCKRGPGLLPFPASLPGLVGGEELDVEGLVEGALGDADAGRVEGGVEEIPAVIG